MKTTTTTQSRLFSPHSCLSSYSRRRSQTPSANRYRRLVNYTCTESLRLWLLFTLVVPGDFALVWTKSNDDRFSSSQDTDATERTDEDLEEPDLVTTITNLVLHRHARLRSDGTHDVDYPSHSVHFESAGPIRGGPQLDIRLLNHQDDTQETLNGCVWLFNKGVTNCDPEPDTETSMSRAVNVFCHEEMVRPMAETVSEDSNTLSPAPSFYVFLVPSSRRKDLCPCASRCAKIPWTTLDRNPCSPWLLSCIPIPRRLVSLHFAPMTRST
jgi:hypothetical protein